MKTILLIDDEAIMRESLSEILTIKGYHVITAHDGNEGLEHLKRSKINLVITDVIMPGKDGIETIEIIREKYKGIKIIVISGGTPLMKKGLCLTVANKIGASCSFEKPVDIDKLLEAIEKCLVE